MFLLCMVWITRNKLNDKKVSQLTLNNNLYMNNEIDQFPYISLTFGRQGGYQTFSNTDTRFAPNKQGRACFFSVWRPVRTASALDDWQIR